MNKRHIGSNLDDFLREDGLLDEAESTAVKRVIAYQIAQEIMRRKRAKSESVVRKPDGE